MNDVRDVIIIGGGPAGYTAALYAARANLQPLVIEGFAVGRPADDHDRRRELPRLPRGRHGAGADARLPRAGGALRHRVRHRRRHRASTSRERPFRVWVGDDEYRAETVIVATGATARQLGLESERHAAGRGVTYCADLRRGLLPRQARDRRRRRRLGDGGGDLPDQVRDEVTVVHRRDEFRASKIMQDRARAQREDRVRDATRSSRRSLGGDGKVTGVRAARHRRPARRASSTADGVFVAIGHDPNTALFLGLLDLDEKGYLVDEAGLDGDEHPRRVRRRRRAGPHLPAGDHRGRHPAAWRRSTPSAGSPRARATGDAFSRAAPKRGPLPRRGSSRAMAYFICPNCRTARWTPTAATASPQAVALHALRLRLHVRAARRLLPRPRRGFSPATRGPHHRRRQGRIRADRLPGRRADRQGLARRSRSTARDGQQPRRTRRSNGASASSIRRSK